MTQSITHPLLISPTSSKSPLTDFEQELLLMQEKDLKKKYKMDHYTSNLSIKSRHSMDDKPKENHYSFMKHTIQPGDTLEGICVYYNVKMAEVKRINKLWTNDSIHLRKVIDIPIQPPSNNNAKDSQSSLQTQQQTKSSPRSLKSRSFPMDPRSHNYMSEPDFLHVRAYPSHSLQSESSSPRHSSLLDSEIKNHTISSSSFSPTKQPILSTRELLTRIDMDVAQISSQILLHVDLNTPRVNTKQVTQLESKTTRVVITPIQDPNAAGAVVSAQAPVKIVLTLTPLLGLLPPDVQESVKADVKGKISKSLSSKLSRKSNDYEWVDLVTIGPSPSTRDSDFIL